MQNTRRPLRSVDLLTAFAFVLAVSWSAAFAQSADESPSATSQSETSVEASFSDAKPAQQAGTRIDRSEFTYDGKPFDHWHKLLITELKPEKRLPALRAVIAFGSNGYAEEVTRDLIQVLNGYDEESLEMLSAVMEGMDGSGIAEHEMMLGMAVYSGLITAAAQKEDGTSAIELPAAMPNLEAITSPMSEIKLVQSAMGAFVGVAKRCSTQELINAVNDNYVRGGMGRNAALSVLAAYRSHEAGAMETVLRVVADPGESEATRDMAIDALVESPPESDALLKTLEPIATSRNSKLRRWGIAAYGKFGESAREASPILLAALSDSDHQVVINAAQSLSKTDQLPRSEAPKLLRLLSNRDESICHDAATQLGELGFFRAYRRGELKEFGVSQADLHDPHLTSGYIDVAKRIEQNTNYSPDIALTVIQILGTMGTEALDAAEPLRKIAANEKQKAELRKAAEEALAKITGSSNPLKETP